MSVALIITGALLVLLALYKAFKPTKGAKPGPQNNWANGASFVASESYGESGVSFADHSCHATDSGVDCGGHH